MQERARPTWRIPAARTYFCILTNRTSPDRPELMSVRAHSVSLVTASPTVTAEQVKQWQMEDDMESAIFSIRKQTAAVQAVQQQQTKAQQTKAGGRPTDQGPIGA